MNVLADGMPRPGSGKGECETMPDLFYPELTRMVAIFTMILAALLIDAASLCLRLAGALPARKRHWAVNIPVHLLLYLLFVMVLIVCTDLLWTKLPPYKIFPTARSDAFWDAYLWLALSWWSALVGVSLLWKSEIHRRRLRISLLLFCVLYPTLQSGASLPMLILTSREGKPGWSAWKYMYVLIALVFWSGMLAVLLLNRRKWEEETGNSRDW